MRILKNILVILNRKHVFNGHLRPAAALIKRVPSFIWTIIHILLVESISQEINRTEYGTPCIHFLYTILSKYVINIFSDLAKFKTNITPKYRVNEYNNIDILELDDFGRRQQICDQFSRSWQHTHQKRIWIFWWLLCHCKYKIIFLL